MIDKLINENRLTVLALYLDEDLEAWKQHRSDFSKTWTNGYDKEQAINKKELYDLKAIPTLYLLDRNKKVLLKDATLVDIITQIQQPYKD